MSTTEPTKEKRKENYRAMLTQENRL